MTSNFKNHEKLSISKFSLKVFDDMQYDLPLIDANERTNIESSKSKLLPSFSGCKSFG